MSHNREFLELKALKNIGAGLQTFHDYYFGRIDSNFMQFLTAFYIAEGLYNTHTQDIIEIEKSNREKIAKAKAEANAKNKTR